MRTKGAKDKKPRKGHGGDGKGNGSPMLLKNAITATPEETSAIVAANLDLMMLPDIDRRDLAQVQQRVGECFNIYIKRGLKPTIAGLASALGYSRQTLSAIVHDQTLGGMKNYTNLPKDVTDFLKKVYFFYENMWESYMVEGKINPVTGIFLGKNNYGYVDKQETVLTPNVPKDDDYSVDEIKQRYATLSDSGQATLAPSDSENVSDFQKKDSTFSATFERLSQENPEKTENET